MTWLSCKEVAELLSVTARDVQLSKNKYEYRYVNGKGRGGRPLQIALESLPQAAQDLYNHKQHEANDILHFTGKQREQADYRAQVVDMYQKSKLSPQDFVKSFNEENPEDPINKSKLFRWQHKYEGKSGAKKWHYR